MFRNALNDKLFYFERFNFFFWIITELQLKETCIMYLYNAFLTNNWWTGFLGFHSHRSTGYVMFTVRPQRVERLQNVESLYNTSNSIVKIIKERKNILQVYEMRFPNDNEFYHFPFEWTNNSAQCETHRHQISNRSSTHALQVLHKSKNIIKTVAYTINKTKTDKTLFLLSGLKATVRAVELGGCFQAFRLILAINSRVFCS
jgi:hypothetical protein